MAKTLSTIFLFTIFISTTLVTSNQSDSFCESISPSNLRLKNLKLTHMRVYRQEVAAPNVTIAGPATPGDTTTLVGSLQAREVVFTETAEITSKELERVVGLVAYVSKTVLTGSYMAHHIAFTGKYRGSTISVLGISRPSDSVRERPIIGGTGHFKMASGYVEARNVSNNPTASAYQFDLCIIHY